MNTNQTPADNLNPVGGEDRPWFNFYPPEVSPVIEPVAEQSIADMVRLAAQKYGSRTAFSNFGHEITFNEVNKLSDDFAAYLQGDLGLNQGDRIVIQMPNLLQYPVAMFGALKAGLIVVNANPLYTVNEMVQVFQDAEPVAIVALANFADKVEKVLPKTSIKHVIITQVADLLPQPKRSIINFAAAKIKKMVPKYSLPQAVKFRDALAAGSQHTLKPIELGLEDVAFLQYTGGTTGVSKAAVLTNANLLANQEQFIGQIRVALGSDTAATVVAALPLYHVFSLTVNCLGFFRYGAHNVLITNPRDIPAFIKTLNATKPDALVLVSTLAGALMDNEKFASCDLSNLKVTVAGGMALRSSISNAWRERTGQDIIEGYGLTEASPVVSVNPLHLPPRIGTIGVPLPSTDVKIVDDNGKDVALGEVGELAVRGPQVMREYWNQPAETANVLTEDGWLLTGDMATMDEDGYLKIVDRKKEMIVVSGFNVYPGEIEDAAMLHPKVKEAGAVPTDDDKAGEVPVLFIVKADDSLTPEELQLYLKQHLTGYKRPRYIKFRDELPKTNVGKVLRRELKESLANETL